MPVDPGDTADSILYPVSCICILYLASCIQYMTKIGLISDTHGWLDQQILHHFSECDEIWHAGDFGNIGIAEKLAGKRLDETHPDHQSLTSAKRLRGVV